MKDEFDSSNNFNEYLGKNMKGTDYFDNNVKKIISDFENNF